MTAPRRRRSALALAGLTLLVAACASTPSPTPSPQPTPTPVASAAPSPSPSASASPSTSPEPSATPAPSVVVSPSVVPAPSVVPTTDPFAGIPLLPADLLLPEGDIAILPQSPRGLAMQTVVSFDLGHCGLYSPVDLDGSLWEPVAGTDGDGGPIDKDAEVGQLINGTSGQAILVTAERLDWRSTQGTPVVVVFRRIPGERSYPGCM